MDTIDLEVLKFCDGWLRSGLDCMLVTVTRTWGSSPRPVGAMMAICENGRVVGSVSGGCIEDDLISRVRAEGIRLNRPQILTYGINAEQAHRFGLPCGGTIQLVAEPLGLHSGISVVIESLQRGMLVERNIRLDTGAAQVRPATADSRFEVTPGMLRTIHGPRWRLLIIGAGQLSRFLSQVAIGLDYQVMVCDPREEYRHTWNVPGASVVHAMPDDAVLDMRLDARSAVVALTHDPKLDDLALMEALKSEAFYVGAIGSRSSQAKRRERLRTFELTDTDLDRLRGPVGLYIGSRTPHEIAISILAELTAARNGVHLPRDLSVQVAKDSLGEPPSADICAL